ncbi:hypothetical protein B0E38_01489 [Streptomyces sp. 111WW2]|nr:hypothetical protein B0E38_01489 [Streptomyces sp. 111WW2]
MNVHDPDPELLTRRRPVALDDEKEAESGRGLGLVDLLAPRLAGPSHAGQQANHVQPARSCLSDPTNTAPLGTLQYGASPRFGGSPACGRVKGRTH